MADKSLIVIGAGLAGLSAGCYARMNGYRTRVVEHNRVPGGVAAAWRKDGYLFDGGIHFMMGTKPETAESKLFDDLGVPLLDKVVPMKVYGRYLDENKGRRIDLTQDLDKFGLDLKAYSGEDTEVIEDLIAAARKLRGMDLGSMGMSQPPELAGIAGRLKDMWAMRRVLKVFTGRFGKSVEDLGKDIKDPWLRELLKSLFLPCVPVWFLAMVLALLADGQLGYLEYGSQDFVQGIARKYQELGGEVSYEATVEEIQVEDGRAVGVVLAGGETLRADAVISAADGHGTIFKLLGGRFADKKIRQRYAKWKLTPSGLIFTFGVTREFPEEVPLTTINLMHPLTVAGRKVGGMLVRIFNYSLNFAPPGKSVIQVELEEPDFEYWHELEARNHGQYNEEKERLTADILSRLEKHYPGLSAKVEVVDVATPHTIWRYTLNHKGAAMAWMPTTKFFKTSLPRTLPGLKNFCMAGQWVMGGGVLPALYSGRHAVQILCHQDGQVFEPRD